jgi:hypothetical protein
MPQGSARGAQSAPQAETKPPLSTDPHRRRHSTNACNLSPVRPEPVEGRVSAAGGLSARPSRPCPPDALMPRGSARGTGKPSSAQSEAAPNTHTEGPSFTCRGVQPRVLPLMPIVQAGPPRPLPRRRRHPWHRRHLLVLHERLAQLPSVLPPVRRPRQDDFRPLPVYLRIVHARRYDA